MANSMGGNNERCDY